MITTLQEELSQVRPMHELKAKTAAKKKEGDANDTEEMADVTNEDEKETDEPQDEKILLLDYKEGDDLTDMTRENLPRYQTDRPVGNSYITDFTCKHCTLCKKYFDTDETSEVHLKTWKHFQAYIRLIHSKGNFKAGTGQNQVSHFFHIATCSTMTNTCNLRRIPNWSRVLKTNPTKPIGSEGSWRMNKKMKI